MRRVRLTTAVVCAALAALASCSKDSEPSSIGSDNGGSSGTAKPAAKPATSATGATPAAMSSAGAAAGGGSVSMSPTLALPASSANVVQKGGSDPLNGKWALADATKDIPGKGAVYAEIDTDKGVIECKMFDDKAPITVANFVGLARGLRPWKNASGDWVKQPAYDGTVFHRIIKGFMIQGGDANGAATGHPGSGEPGYVIPDEVWAGATHDHPGQICMANRGPNTNGAQFFITDAGPKHLDSGYTIFGDCTPVDRIHDIANQPTRGDQAVKPTVINKVTFLRK